MDVGCYCVSAARLLAGTEPDAIEGRPTATRNGVDAHFTATLGFPGGVTAHLECAFDAELTGLEAIGARGRVAARDPWHGRHAVIERDGERVDVEQADPYRRELDDIEAAISDGRPPRLGRDDALGQARVLEALLHG
jgi:D-xylose 1-dehydrogenase (NADP+, D-xylono-1,5-lactone-forming)